MGKLAIPAQYDSAYSFREGLAVIEQNGKYGFIDRTGTIVISTQYDDAHSFKNNQAKVKLDDETFYIDKTGKHIQ